VADQRPSIDRAASFKFVAGQGVHARGRAELRFDMFEAEYTHEARLLHLRGVALPLSTWPATSALVAIAEVVHDIDLRDGKFARPETAGVERLVTGIAAGLVDDEARLAAALCPFPGAVRTDSRGGNHERKDRGPLSVWVPRSPAGFASAAEKKDGAALDTAKIEELTGAKGALDAKEGRVQGCRSPRFRPRSDGRRGAHDAALSALTAWAAFNPGRCARGGDGRPSFSSRTRSIR